MQETVVATIESMPSIPSLPSISLSFSYNVPLKLALVTGGACNPCNRSGDDAGVRVENEQTKTERIPDSTGMPAWVTSPPKINAVPADGFSTRSASRPSGFSLVSRFPAQNPVPPPPKLVSGDKRGIKMVNAR